MADSFTTEKVSVPTSPLDLIIGQDEAVAIARIAAKQRRHLLLVGPPGTGKSMIAQAIASLLPKPRQEVWIVHNPDAPERPIVQVCIGACARQGRKKEYGHLIDLHEAPIHISERLGYKCPRCGKSSPAQTQTCSVCGADKYRVQASPFDDLLLSSGGERQESHIFMVREHDGKSENVVFERAEGLKIRLYSEKEWSESRKDDPRRKLRKLLLPITRSTFVQATGASETELLGDVRHDPYGGHSTAGGTLPYSRIVVGAIHEAHEGVLFIDEMSNLGNLQKFILSAMQEKAFPIAGRNPTSTGASVRVDKVPCDFILVGATNTNDLSTLLPPLRSRIVGDGYEVLLNTTMPDTEANRAKIVQFIAQEIHKDGRIPHAAKDAVDAIIGEAKSRAKSIDEKNNSISLRLRGVSGLIKLAGDIAKFEETELINAKHVKEAKEKARTIEEQIGAKYDSWWKAGMSDYGARKPAKGGSEVA